MSRSVSNRIEKLLATLRDEPVNSEQLDDGVLGEVYSYLMDIPSTSSGDLHWFCEKVNIITIDAATFLLRLFAYNSDPVEVWKKRLQQCLTCCSSCVGGLETAKVVSQTTFLGAFNIVQDVLNAGFTLTPALDLNQQMTLAELPPATVYRMVSNWTIFCDSRIQTILRTYAPSNCSTGWPTDPLPPGMFVLLIVASPVLRTWAKGHASNSSLIAPDKFLDSHVNALGVLAHAIHASHSGPAQPSLSTTAPPNLNTQLEFAGSFDLWSGFHSALRLIPPEFLTSTSRQRINIGRMVTSHLHDQGPHFVEVLKCFILMVKRLGKALWNCEGPEYPQIVFDAIKDNPAFLELLQSSDPSQHGIWHLAWFQEFLLTIRDHQVYGDVLTKLIDFLCEEAQHERFRSVRPAVLKTAIGILSSDFRRCRDSHRNQLDVVLSTLDSHSNIIISVAYANDYHVANWKDARDSARHLVEEVITADIQEVTRTIKSLCQALGRIKQDTVPDALSILTIRTQMWKKLYSTSPTQDTTAIASIICIVAKAAHLASIRSSVFSKQWKFPQGDQLLDKVNQSLHTIQSGFLALISTFSDYGISTSGLEVLRHVGAGKAVIMLLLSPIEDFQVAAQTLIGLAFDVDGRMDCFRALLENLPVEALDGIFDFLVTFERYAATLPEACSLSKTLVRCFTDIVEVLCTSPDGLLQSSIFLRSNDDQGPAARMLQFWKLTTKALSTIYKRTPMWAPYFDTPDMVVWMRDALILARDMLSHWRVIENAANSFTKASAKSATPGKISRIGQQMVGTLQEFLPELVRWLRLTDEELLHQSFALLQSLLDLMKNVCIRPSDIGLSKLRKHVEGAMNNTKIREDRTRLDSARLAKLAGVLAYFDEDDEVEIVSHTVSSKLPVKEEKAKSVQEPRPYIQGKAQSSKVTGHFPRTSLPSVHSSSSSAKIFSEHDRKTLDSQTTIPSFRRTSTTTVATAGSSKTVPQNQRSKNEPKNEAASRSAVSESSESSQSDSDEENLAPPTGLSTLGRFPKSPRNTTQKTKRVERRQIKTLDIPIRSNPMQERLLRQKQQRNAALRLRPDISDLHRVLLSWDYGHVGPEPPGEKIQLAHVPDRFESYEHYFRVFQPLLLMECWAQLVQSKEEKQDNYPCKVESRLFSDDWLEIDLSISESVRRDWYLAETDIVLLWQHNHPKRTMAKVKSYKALPTGIQFTVRCYARSGPGDPGLQVTTLWQISKVFSLSTLHREYAALLSLQYNDLCDFILRPSLPKAPEVDAKDLKYTMDEFKVNEPQATAILKAMNTEGFSLIQGPPGTGKTSTICGLVTRFMSQRPRLNVPIPVPPNQPWKVAPQEKPLGGKKVLLCAPSNAAIDEIALRIKNGYTGSQRKTNTINVVRVGAEQAMNMSVRDISLDYLVDQKLNVNSKPLNDIGNEIKATRVEIETIKQTRRLMIEELTGTHDNGARTMALENEVRQLNSKRQALITKLDRMKDQQKSDSRTLDTLRRNTRREILTQADIVCSTLSGSGHELLSDIEFEMVIIDEAAQSIELSSLIPLKYGCNRCVMVGDPQQLPPTVLSQEASRFAYNQSLFVRLQKSRQDSVVLLSIQYRMHPDISRLPSRVFYGDRLLDGPDMMTKTKQPWHEHKKFGTYKFFNVNGNEENNGHSIKNQSECQVAAALFSLLRQEYASINFDFRIGVVSMYRAQIVELRRLFEQRFGKELVGKIDFNTVDGFQGQEKDVIILSCVRAGPGLQSVGFLSDTRRMNVALTRAKSSLFILGNAATLERSDATWRQIIEDARSSSSLVDVGPNYFARATSPTPVTAPLKKKPRTVDAPVQQAPVPQDLVTPQQLKAASDRNAPQPTGSAVHHPIPPIDETAVPGSKRPADTDGTSASARASKPEQPRKRQKTQPSIFIPKRRT
ncbi:hypothetical protein BYT27DRAFT_6878132 [Phlegmacium glaucopus]|nr:hypothetical protein BYT27DRAFT_6878132 [Phlegmacium glaucopus]